PLTPSAHGFCANAADLLFVVEGVLRGHFPLINRRVVRDERDQVIRSGNIFVCETSAGPIKRWTDGLDWSNSRVMDGGFVYRQLREGAVMPAKGEGRKAAEDAISGRSAAERDRLRPYIGSLFSTALFHDDGLIKKMISIATGGLVYHVVAYYNLDDVQFGRL
ncbi:hypothetical protein BT67DRAFT_340637, partial [Trichocladium antarcticum]